MPSIRHCLNAISLSVCYILCLIVSYLFSIFCMSVYYFSTAYMPFVCMFAFCLSHHPALCLFSLCMLTVCYLLSTMNLSAVYMLSICLVSDFGIWFWYLFVCCLSAICICCLSVFYLHYIYLLYIYLMSDCYVMCAIFCLYIRSPACLYSVCFTSTWCLSVWYLLAICLLSESGGCLIDVCVPVSKPPI